MRALQICRECEHWKQVQATFDEFGPVWYKCQLSGEVPGALADARARPVPEACKYRFEHVVWTQGHESERRYGTPDDMKDAGL